MNTHRCNETDKDLVSKNYNRLEPSFLESLWPHLRCFDNPDKIFLQQSYIEHDWTSLVIVGSYCIEEEGCKSDEEIREWKNITKNLIFISN